MADYTRPEGLIQYNDENSLWIKLSARVFKSQKGTARAVNYIQKGTTVLGSWKLLAPTEIAEDVGHEWNEYESIGSKVAGKIGKTTEGMKQFTELLKGVSDMKVPRGKGAIGKAQNIAEQMAGAAAKVSIPDFKVDSAMVYQGSKRREYTLAFQFALTSSKNSTPKNSVFEPIRELEKLSCASIDEGNLVGINFPAIFKVTSGPSNIIKINNAVLTAVQPTWKAPYIGGYPSMCELQITLMDLEPLYRQSWEGGGIVKVGAVESGTGSGSVI